MEKRNIKVTNLFIDLDNFRFEHQTSQVEAINKMVEENKDNLYTLIPQHYNLTLFISS